MTDPKRKRVSDLLDRMRSGDRSAFDELLPLVYDELHQLAHRQRNRWRGNETLNTTALVHEAYMKLASQDKPNWQSEAHFLATAARAVRHILINYARERAATKRGGELQRVSLGRVDDPSADKPSPDTSPEDLMALDDALKRLAELSGQQSRIVECRFFGGMTVKQTAEALGLSTATVNRRWTMAQSWLYRELRTDISEQRGVQA